MYHHRSLEEAYVKFMFPSAHFVTLACAMAAVGSIFLAGVTPSELPVVGALQFVLAATATLLGCVNFFRFTSPKCSATPRVSAPDSSDRNSQSENDDGWSGSAAVNPHAKAGELVAFTLIVFYTVLSVGLTYSRQQNCFLRTVANGEPQFNSCFAMLPTALISPVVFMCGIIPIRQAYAVPLLLCAPLAAFAGRFWYPDRSVDVGPKVMFVCLTVFIASFLIVYRESQCRNRFELWLTLRWERSRNRRRINRVQSTLEMIAEPSALNDILERTGKHLQNRAQLKEEVPVVVARIDNFPSWNQRFPPIMAVELLDVYYTQCDVMAKKWKMDVVRRFGDLFVATSGFTSRSTSLCQTECLQSTLQFLDALFTFSSRSRLAPDLYSGRGQQRAIPLRIGVGFGEATYSILSATKLAIVVVGPAVDDAETCAEHSHAARTACVASSFALRFANHPELFYGPVHQHAQSGTKAGIFLFSGIDGGCKPTVERSVRKRAEVSAPPPPSPPLASASPPLPPTVAPSKYASELTMILEHVVSLTNQGFTSDIRFKSKELELRFDDDTKIAVSTSRHVSQMLTPIISLTLLTMYLLSDPETYSAPSIFFLFGWHWIVRVPSRIADALGISQSRFVLPAIVFQAVGVIAGVVFTGTNILTRSLSYLVALMLLCIAFADVPVPWWVVAFLEIAISAALAIIDGVHGDSTISSMIPVPFICLLFVVVARRTELNRRQSFLYVQLSKVMVSETREALEAHQNLLDRLLPKFVIDAVARRSVERYQSCITSHVPDVVLMLIKASAIPSVPGCWSSAPFAPKATLPAILRFESELSRAISEADRCHCAEVVWFDGDSVLIGGPLQMPEVDESHQFVASRGAANMVPMRQRFRFVCEALADEASIVLLKVLRALIARAASCGLHLTTVLHRGDGVGHVIGQSTPRFDVGGAVGAQLFAIHQAAPIGSAIVTHQFHSALVSSLHRGSDDLIAPNGTGQRLDCQHGRSGSGEEEVSVKVYENLGLTIASNAIGNASSSIWRIASVGDCVVYTLTSKCE